MQRLQLSLLLLCRWRASSEEQRRSIRSSHCGLLLLQSFDHAPPQQNLRRFRRITTPPSCQLSITIPTEQRIRQLTPTVALRLRGMTLTSTEDNGDYMFAKARAARYAGAYALACTPTPQMAAAIGAYSVESLEWPVFAGGKPKRRPLRTAKAAFAEIVTRSEFGKSCHRRPRPEMQARLQTTG
jgi:hypothetical protein